jgi:hypothetical protein
MTIRSEFDVHMLNEAGISKAREIAEVYSHALDAIERLCGPDGREMAIVRTKLQESAFFAKRAMAVRPENQKAPG